MKRNYEIRNSYGQWWLVRIYEHGLYGKPGRASYLYRFNTREEAEDYKTKLLTMIDGQIARARSAP